MSHYCDNRCVFPYCCPYVNGFSSDAEKWVQQAYCHYFYLSSCTMLVEMDRSSELNDNANLYDTIRLHSNTWCTLFMLSESIKWVGLNPWLHIASLVLDKWNRKWSISIHFWRQINARRSLVHIIIYIGEWSTATVSSIDLHNMCWGWCGLSFFFFSKLPHQWLDRDRKLPSKSCVLREEETKTNEKTNAWSQRQMKKMRIFYSWVMSHDSVGKTFILYLQIGMTFRFQFDYTRVGRTAVQNRFYLFIFCVCQTPDSMDRTRARRLLPQCVRTFTFVLISVYTCCSL